ncbi:MAG: PorT family protein [Bacteroidetes bacterium]|nr:PorT family protein [Bacteroidota bacterium]
MRHFSLYIFVCVLLSAFPLSGQAGKGEFFSRANLSALFCQIDGDQAKGYHKFGYSFGFISGQGLGKSWSYEAGISYSVRGSRRPYDPDNAAAASFHLDFQMLDIPVFLIKYKGKWNFGPGIRTTYLLKATDKEGFVLHVKDNLRTVGILGCFTAGYKLSSRFIAQGEAQYSLSNIRSDRNGGNVFNPTGVYHNVISIGLKYALSAEPR